ncbi:MAG: formate dehydrogenase accessory sulfurtransferase FdhD [Gammaproteobacteria bacterium]|nr:formate dehydrogenase accessory sulfurtransferase FdhD [Gammaproteobacteria bacterium]
MSALPHPPGARPRGSVLRPVERWHGRGRRLVQDHVADEVPVALVYNDTPFAVMMATPADLADFAVGFSLSEGIVDEAGDVAIEGIDELVEGLTIRMRIPGARAAELAGRRRNLDGRSGCGVCGSEQLEASVRHPAPVAADPRVAACAMQRALAALRHGQPLNALTGAVHAAGWAALDGTILLVREDGGRHNALDKLIGGMHSAGLAPGAGFLVVTSRASYEMAMKAASAGIALMAAISAPTSLAIALAERAHLTLVGFAREDGYAVYSHPQRLLAPAGGGVPAPSRAGGSAAA